MHGELQIRFLLDAKTSLAMLLEEEHEDVLHKMKTILYKKTSGLVDVRDGGHKTRPCICGKHGKPIYVKTQSNALDGGQKNHAILE